MFVQRIARERPANRQLNKTETQQNFMTDISTSALRKPNFSPLPPPIPAASQNIWQRLSKLSWPWRITWLYLSFFLFLPIVALVLKASSLGPLEIWEIATAPVALSTYNDTQSAYAASVLLACLAVITLILSSC